MSIAAFASLSVVGPGLLTLGIWTLVRRQWYDGVPLAEVLIDRAAGIEPPQRTASDRAFARFHAWASVVFGSFFTLCLCAVLFSSFSE
ncbi:hypothetical protein COC42_07525 [Sphingomonas spermidinifaciens]|uniref:DUF4149 domain-containing protein n=1 Tax=Sphingomonas spermidinifaciens TaxID=1141889 RepID=A0A2A4B6Q5_9SPHN|nr:hypothetical protein COC42_07525 [Sphingomonas spermidinifaciens]